MQGGSFSDTVEDLELEVRNIFNEVKDFLPEEPATSELAAQLGGLGFPNSGSLRKDVENLVYGGFELNIGALDKLKSMLDPDKIARLFYADGSPKAGALVLGVLLLVLGYLGVNKYRTSKSADIKNALLTRLGDNFNGNEQDFDFVVDLVKKKLSDIDKSNIPDNEHSYSMLYNLAMQALEARYDVRSEGSDDNLVKQLQSDERFMHGLDREVKAHNGLGIYMLISGLINWTNIRDSLRLLEPNMPAKAERDQPKIPSESGGHWMSDFDLDCCIKYLLIGIVVLLLLMVIADRDMQEKMTKGFGTAINSLV